MLATAKIKKEEEAIKKREEAKQKEIEKELGKKAIRNYMPLQKGDVKQTVSNTNLLKKITGYNPKTNYKVGIKKFLKWYVEYYN